MNERKPTMSKITPWVLIACLAVPAVNQSTKSPAQPLPPQKSNIKVVVPPPTSLILPPVEYDKDYEGNLIVQEVATIEELLETCKLTVKWALGCSTHTSWECHVYLVPESVMKKYGWWREAMLRHELGHCNGWPGDHPGQRPYTPYQHLRFQGLKVDGHVDLPAKKR
jgi:hypothetical protein